MGEGLAHRAAGHEAREFAEDVGDVAVLEDAGEARGLVAVDV